jgi:MFS family permease
MSSPSSRSDKPWYHGISGYQWLVLALASAGWVFDVYEGQIYNITSEQLLADVLPPPPHPTLSPRRGGEGRVRGNQDIAFHKDVFLGVFLVGGALGGVVFGSVADRWGRRPTLVVTILTYSLFSGLTFFVRELWQVGVLRFLVAFGVGGEWSVAAALVAEVFSVRSRAQAGSIFHATSTIGTWLAGLAGLAVGAHWRYAYLLGVLPALLVVAVRVGVAESATWQKAASSSSGRVRELLANPVWRRRAVLGLLLAAVGLGMFWSVTVAGQDLARTFLVNHGVPNRIALEKAKFAYGMVQATGGGVGLLSFGPLSARWGRRRTFVVFHLAALAIVPATCYLPAEYWQLLVLLPVYGFFTLGMHAGYAVYFPELFPTRLRATGAGFCFNGGRLVAAALLIFSAWLKALPDLDISFAVTLLSGLYLLGVPIVWFLPETRDQPLPEDSAAAS